MRYAFAIALAAILFAQPVLPPPTAWADTEADRARCQRLNEKFVLLWQAGEESEAAEIGEQIVSLVETAFGPQDSNYPVSVNNLAVLYHSMGEYAKAERLLKKAMTICRKSVGEEHANYARTLYSLAEVYYSMGEYTKAEPLYDRAVHLLMGYCDSNKADREDDLMFGEILKSLAQLYYSMGEYEKALPLWKGAMKTQREALRQPLRHRLPGYVEVRPSPQKAKPFEEKAVERMRQALGEDDSRYAACLHDLRFEGLSVSEYAEAERIFNENLESARQILGDDSPRYAVELDDLATLHWSMGEYTKAEPLLKKATELKRKALGEDHLGYATSLNRLASLYADMGEYAKAEPPWKKAAAVFRRALGEDHPTYATTVNNLARLYVARGEPEKGLTCFHAGLQALHTHTIKTIAGLSQERQLGFLQHVWRNLVCYVSFVQGHSDTPGAVVGGAEWVAKWKALGAEVQTKRYRLLQLTKDKELKDVLKALAAARQELARMTLTPPANMDLDEVHRRREAVRQEVEELESTLAQRSSQFAELRRVDRAELGQIARAMPEGGVLLDYAHVRDFNFKAKGKQKKWGPWRYVLFITLAGKVPKPVMVDLGLAQPIDDAIGALRKAVAEVEAGRQPESDEQIREKLTAVRKLVVDPALPHIRDNEH